MRRHSSVRRREQQRLEGGKDSCLTCQRLARSLLQRFSGLTAWKARLARVSDLCGVADDSIACAVIAIAACIAGRWSSGGRVIGIGGANGKRVAVDGRRKTAVE